MGQHLAEIRLVASDTALNLATKTIGTSVVDSDAYYF
jgi:hypothetical protein